jgi:DNA mismatch repair protein MutL
VTTESKIQLLEEHIIDQIKAGEVIERPSTLIKELIENSIDAGSTKIDIHIINNGLDLIEVGDNGNGINPSDLPLAFCRHATSKIHRFEDIYHLGSYGFRGEALASIASISKVTCETQTTTHSGLIKIEGGETITHQEETKSNGDKTGTKLFIKDLFFNTPVRMKFIQSKTSEKNQLKKIIHAYLLTTPNVEFSVKWDDQDKNFYPVPEEGNFQQRIKDTLYPNKKATFVYNENAYDGIHFEIYLTRESSRGNAHKQNYLFINERYVQDIQLHKIVLNSANFMWPEGESGSYLAKITVPSDEIDVNIHPNKTVVKLFKASKVYSLTSSTIKQIEAKYSLKENQNNTAIQSTAPEFEFNQSLTTEAKSFEYKEFDFTSSESTENYFQNLHSNQNSTDLTQQRGPKFLKKFQNLSIIELEGEIYILNRMALIHFDLKNIFSQKSLLEDIVPLMVSRPIKVRNTVNDDGLDFLLNCGFELDKIDKETFLLRSFPKAFQHYPYLKLVEQIINNPDFSQKNGVEQLELKEFNFNSISDHYTLDRIDGIANTVLLENNILKTINELDLKALYEKK